MILVRILLLVNFTFICSHLSLWAQDERLIRQMLTSYEGPNGTEQDVAPPKWEADSPYYNFDLNSDGQFEKFQWAVKDGLHSLKIIDSKNHLLLEVPLKSTGGGGWPYKIRITDLSPTSKLILIFYYQGYRAYLEPHGESTLYFITFDNNDFKTLKATQGPYIWEENESLFHRYHQRYFNVEIKDLNQDGRKEIMVKSNKISRVFFYLGNGNWKMI